MAEITLQLHDYRMEALEEVMEERGTSVEKFCQDALIELYCSEVPFEKQREIQERIDGKRGRTESPVSESPPPKPDPPIESVRPLRAEDMEFHDDVLRFHNFLNFKFVPNPALCEAFGVGDNIEEPGALVSVYANFDMAAGRPAETLNVTLTVDESVSVDGAADYQYRMSAEEPRLFRRRWMLIIKKSGAFPLRSVHGSTLKKRAEKQTARCVCQLKSCAYGLQKV